MDVIELIKLVGFPAALVIFFVWQSSAREKSTNEKIAAQDAFFRDELLSISKKSIASTENSTKTLDEANRLMVDMKEYLAGRS